MSQKSEKAPASIMYDHSEAWLTKRVEYEAQILHARNIDRV